MVLATQRWFWGWLQGRVGRCLHPSAVLVLPAWHHPGRSRLLTSLEPPVPMATMCMGGAGVRHGSVTSQLWAPCSLMCPEGASVWHGSVTGQLWAPCSLAEPASSGSSAAPVLGCGDFPSQKQWLISRGKPRGKKNKTKQCKAAAPWCPQNHGPSLELSAGGQGGGRSWRLAQGSGGAHGRSRSTMEPLEGRRTPGCGAGGGVVRARLLTFLWGCLGAVLGCLLVGEGGGDPSHRRAAITSQLAPGVSCG